VRKIGRSTISAWQLPGFSLNSNLPTLDVLCIRHSRAQNEKYDNGIRENAQGRHCPHVQMSTVLPSNETEISQRRVSWQTRGEVCSVHWAYQKIRIILRRFYLNETFSAGLVMSERRKGTVKLTNRMKIGLAVGATLLSLSVVCGGSAAWTRNWLRAEQQSKSSHTKADTARTPLWLAEREA